MRIVEPKRAKELVPEKPKKSIRKKLPLIIALVLLASVATFILIRTSAPDYPESSENPVNQQANSTDKSDKVIESGLITFSGNEFRLLFDQLLLPNLDKVDLPPAITGNDIADTRIRQIAELRGYRLRSSPVDRLPYIDAHQLQESVRDSWYALKRAANAADLQLTLTSGYRSVEDQRYLFNSRLSAEGATVAEVAAGQVDKEVDTVLITTAIPGYSKHHTGYTLDFVCGGFAFEDFKNSSCNEWLSANNFKVAKEHGFIPSYPPDADLQGPEPEAWEYVWVGTDVLYL